MTESSVDNPLRTFLYAIGSVAGFSLMNVFVKLAADGSSIAQIVFFRNFFAFLPILYIIYRHGGLKLLKSSNHIGHVWRGFVGITAMVFYFLSFSMLPLTDATSIHFAAPLIITVLSVPLLKERVGLVRWCAVIIGLSAVLFMLQPSGNGNMAGSIVALIAACLGAIAMLTIRALGKTEHPLTITFYFTLFGTIAGGIAMIFMWQPLSGIILTHLVLAGLIGGLAQLALTNAYAHAPVAYVAPFSYIAIFFAVISDIMIWGKWPDWQIWAGSFVIICSGLFVVYREARKDRVTIDLPSTN